MEQTLGKRIAEHRKQLKLTQDQLAEQLGITAQAVSKWENDQSCPDITMLPRLAEIFGITTDALLGVETEEKAPPVHEAEVVQEQDDHNFEFNIGDHQGKGQWSFHWDSGRKNAVLFAVLVLWVGALMLLSKVYDWEVSFWAILWPSALVFYGLDGLLSKFSIFGLGCTLFGGYSLVSNLGIWKLDIAEELVFPMMILLFGAGLLIDALKKPRKPQFHVTRNGKDVRKNRCECSNEDGFFHCNLTFGERDYPVNVPQLTGGDASVSFGELTVDLSGCQSVTENCYIQANCSFGELRLKVPRRFRVEPQTDTAFAAVNVVGHPDSEPEGILYLDGNVSFGEIEIRYI